MAEYLTLPHGNLKPPNFEQNFPAQNFNFEGDYLGFLKDFDSKQPTHHPTQLINVADN